MMHDFWVLNHVVHAPFPCWYILYRFHAVMIQAGNAIDCSLGVTFGLSTLTAAAIGGLVSNVAGILFGYVTVTRTAVILPFF